MSVLLIGAASAGEVTAREQAPRLLGTIEFRTDDRAPPVVQSVRSLALDPTGGVFVADNLGHRVLWLSADGGSHRNIATRGDGPGRVQSPCCIHVGPEGQLVVASFVVRRVEILEDPFSARRPTRRITFREGILEPGTSGYVSAPLFVRWSDAGEATVGILSWRDRILTRSLVDESGNLVGEPAFLARLKEVPMLRIPRGARQMEFGIPFHPATQWAPDASGRYAIVPSTGDYVVEVFREEGDLLHVISRDIPAPPLTDEEIREALAPLRAAAPDQDLPVPSVKPRIARHWYDADGRLWVERVERTSEGLRHADVYDREGELVFEARWPAEVALHYGAIRGEMAWGALRGPFGELYLARLRFAPVR